MALDHSNGLSGAEKDGELWSNDTIQLTGTDFISVLSFITRYITHMAAIGFFFLMGIGMHFLYQTRYFLHLLVD